VDAEAGQLAALDPLLPEEEGDDEAAGVADDVEDELSLDAGDDEDEEGLSEALAALRLSVR
jgi:hypothetical protein